MDVAAVSGGGFGGVEGRAAACYGGGDGGDTLGVVVAEKSAVEFGRGGFDWDDAERVAVEDTALEERRGGCVHCAVEVIWVELLIVSALLEILRFVSC